MERRGAESPGRGRDRIEGDELAGLHAAVQGRCARRLDTDDTDARAQGPRRRGDAGDQAAAADGDHERVRVGGVGQDLQRDRALAGDHDRIGKRVDVGQAARLGGVARRTVGIVPVGAVHDDRGAPGGDLVALRRRRAFRHEDRRRRTRRPADIGDGQPVVAAGCRADAAGDFGRR